MTLPYRDCALFVLPIPICRAVKVGRVREVTIITQCPCELGAATRRPIPICRAEEYVWAFLYNSLFHHCRHQPGQGFCQGAVAFFG